MTSNFSASLILFNALLWVLCASPLHKQVNTHSLMASSMFSNIATSLNISSVMPSSLSPPIDHFVNRLSNSLDLHSAAFVYSLIKSWADSLLFLCNFWYCNKIIIQLWCGLNLLCRTENIPFVVLYFFFFLLCEYFHHQQAILTWPVLNNHDLFFTTYLIGSSF